MVRLLKQFMSDQKGQALTIVLCLLAIGGLTIVPMLNYATLVLKSNRMLNEKERGIYAADAGVDYALWSLKRGSLPPTQLSDNVNQMAVNIATESKGLRTLAFGGWVVPGQEARHLAVSGNITPEAGKYKYTITTVWDENENITLLEAGVKLPPGYSYLGPATRSDNKTAGTPTDNYTDGAHMLRWQWSGSACPYGTKAGWVWQLSFYITGDGSQADKYAWVVADGQTNVGTVGEIFGTLYKITATAKRPADNRTTATIVAAPVMVQSGAAYIVSWHISN